MGKQRIIWVPTMRCYLRCAYCGSLDAIRKNGTVMSYFPGLGVPYHPPYPVQERDASYWVQTLGRYAPANIDVSGGGEPTHYEPLADVVASLPEHDFFLTSNLMGPVDQLLRYDNLRHVTASYHYLEMTTEPRARRFWAMADAIRMSRRGLNITLVAYPPAWKQFRQALDDMLSHGYQANIHWFTAPGFSWAQHADKMTELRNLKAAGVRIVDGLHEWRGGEMKGARICEAGRSHGLTYGPDGRAFRCWSHMTQNRPIDTMAADGYCDTPCSFPCDWDAPKVPTAPRLEVARG